MGMMRSKSKKQRLERENETIKKTLLDSCFDHNDLNLWRTSRINILEKLNELKQEIRDTNSSILPQDVDLRRRVDG